MADNQTYAQRVSRLAEVRRKDSASKRGAVLAALSELKREDRRITRRAVIARAGVHRNFLQRHKDLAFLIDTEATDAVSAKGVLATNRVTAASLRTELATTKHRNRELQDRVKALERRLGVVGAPIDPTLLDQHPVVVELRAKMGRLEAELIEKDRVIGSLHEDVEVLRETNRSLVREYGLATQ
jgi:protein subunit release factor A